MLFNSNLERMRRLPAMGFLALDTVEVLLYLENPEEGIRLIGFTDKTGTDSVFKIQVAIGHEQLVQGHLYSTKIFGRIVQLIKSMVTWKIVIAPWGSM